MNLLENSKINGKARLNTLLGYDEQFKKCGQSYDSVYALLLRKTGVAFYNLKDYLGAVNFTNRSIQAIRNDAGRTSNNLQELSDDYYNLQIYYDSLQEKSLQIEAIDSCIAIDLRVHTDYYNSCILAGDKAKYLFNEGEYGLCIKYADLGEKLIQKYYRYPDSLGMLMDLINTRVDALIFLQQYSRAEQLLANKVEECLRLKKTEFVGNVYILLALLKKHEGDYEESVRDFKKSYKYNAQVGFKKGCAQALSNLAELYAMQLHQYRQALIFNRQALQFADGVDSIYILNNLANVCVQTKNFDSAFYFYQRSFDHIRPGINEIGLLQHTQDFVTKNITEYVTTLVLDKGDACLAQFKTNFQNEALYRAINIYKVADRLLENVRNLQYETQSKLFWRSHARRLYEHAIEACYLENDPATAFYFFEKSRAVLLNDQLNQQKWLDQHEIASQSQLQKQLAAEEKRLTGLEKNSDGYEELEKVIFSDRQKINSLQDEIRTKNPFYYKTFLDSAGVSVQDVRQTILKDHQAIVEILSGDSCVYVLAVLNHTMSCQKIDKNVFESLSTAYVTYLSQPDILNRNFNEFLTISQELYRLMFRNITLPQGRIIISPDGKYFPFEALVVSTKPLTYFLDNHAVSYTYSARYLLKTFKSSPSSSGSFLGIAPVKFPGLASLPGSDGSLSRLQQYFSKATNFSGDQATKANFLNEFYKYRVIQLYAHATDSDYTGEPMIFFSDSALALSDLLPEQKPLTDLIVLSACQTASGKIYSGEGIFSFNRSFAALGIPSSISNLWQVDNEATYQLTELFYKYMSAGLPLDIALQKAKKEFMGNPSAGQQRLPCYWAAPVLTGKTDVIELPKKSIHFTPVIVAILVIVAFLVWMIKWRRAGAGKTGPFLS